MYQVDLDLDQVHLSKVRREARPKGSSGKNRCKTCDNVTVDDKFQSNAGGGGGSFCTNHRFDCDSEGVIYFISCNSCGLQYVGSTITSFRLRFNNHKSSLNRYGRGQTNVAGQHLYARFFGEGHLGYVANGLNLKLGIQG